MKHPAIILAAGASTRLGEPKQLVRWENKTLLEHAIDALRASGRAPIIVVLGAYSADIAQALPDDIIEVINDAWETGMGSSLRVGLDALEAHCHAPRDVMLCLSDQPLIHADDLRALQAALTADVDAAAASFDGLTSPPVCFSAASLKHLRELPARVGARKLLRNGTLRVTHVPMYNAAFDVDTPDDLQRLQEQPPASPEPECPNEPNGASRAGSPRPSRAWRS